MMHKVCMQFYFSKAPAGKDPDSLIFVKEDRVIKVNFNTNVIDTIYEFDNKLNRQPEFFQMNSQQDIMVISSQEDGIYKDIKKGLEIDLDEKFNVGIIKEILYDEDDK
jgi:hypothetical protein